MGRVLLIADDSAENRALVKTTLEDDDYRVVLANDGSQAIAAFMTERPDCVLLDIRMSGTDGISACQRIRELPGGEEVAIVFLTAQRDVETFDRALAAGGDDFMTKPFRPAELVVRIETALRLRRIATERSELTAQIKQQRDQLLRLQLQKEQFTAFLVHDLKNPVNSIDLNAQLVIRDRNGSERAKRAGASIQQETRALLRMITNLLDIAKADEERLAPACQPIVAESFVGSVLDELTPLAASSGVALAAEVTVAQLHVDPDLMHRVLANLVENAIRHTPEGSEVRITIAPADDGCELRVADAGPGVPVELRDKIFERFESASSARANRGLGLAFCKLAVEAQRGRIWVEDRAPGAVFVMRMVDVDQ